MALPAIIGAIARVGAAEAATSAMGAEAGTGARAVAMLGQVQGAMNQVGVAARQSSDLIGSLAASITGKMGKALTMWIGWVEAAAKPIEELVRVANPAHADAFMRAVNDAFGVVGRMLIPVMDAFTRTARKVGDAVAGLEPVFRPAMDAIAHLVDVVGDELKRSIQEQAPVFELLADAIKQAAEAASVAARIFGEAWRMLGGVGRFAARQLGFDGGTFNKDASAFGAAARTARFVQPKQIADDAIKASLMASIPGKNTGKKPEERSADTLDKILAFLERTPLGSVFGRSDGNMIGAGTGQKSPQGAGLVDAIPQVRLMRWALARMEG